MLRMWTCGSGESREGCGLQAFPLRPLDGAEPAEAGVGVFGRNALEVAHPSLEQAVVGIDVLGVPRAVGTDAGCQIHGVMRDAKRLRRIAGIRHEAGRRARAITGDQHRHLFFGGAAPGGFATPMSRRPAKPATLPLAGAQKERFAGFGDTAQHLDPHSFRRCEEAMAPAESRVARNSETGFNLFQRQSVAHRLCLPDPFPAQAQMRQRRTGEGIEGLGARPAPGSIAVALRSASADPATTRRLWLGVSFSSLRISADSFLALMMISVSAPSIRLPD